MASITRRAARAYLTRDAEADGTYLPASATITRESFSGGLLEGDRGPKKAVERYGRSISESAGPLTLHGPRVFTVFDPG